MHKINIIINNNIIQVVNTDNNISYILYKIHTQYKNNNIKLEQVNLFEYNLYII